MNQAKGKAWKVWLKPGETHTIRTYQRGDRKYGCAVHTVVKWDEGFDDPTRCNGMLFPGDRISFRGLEEKAKMTSQKIPNPHRRGLLPTHVWSNLELDELRRTKCLCLNCACQDEDPPYRSCPVASALFGICQTNSMAVAVTRCGVQDKDGELLFKVKK